MVCKICGSQSEEVFRARILRKYTVRYYYCDYCGFLQTEEPYWLNEAYSESISILDTGYVRRNIEASKTLTILLSIFFDKNKKFLDYGGGYGLLTRLMRDIGFDFYWYDIYTPNLFSRGFEHREGYNYEAITALEVFEHFANPINEIEIMLKLSKKHYPYHGNFAKSSPKTTGLVVLCSGG